jgi:hypothetical protein
MNHRIIIFWIDDDDGIEECCNGTQVSRLSVVPLMYFIVLGVLYILL